MKKLLISIAFFLGGGFFGYSSDAVSYEWNSKLDAHQKSSVKTVKVLQKMNTLFSIKMPSKEELKSLSGAVSSGGFYVGNGGDAVVCSSGEGVKNQNNYMLDLIEGKTVKNYTYELLKNLSREDVLKELVRRLEFLYLPMGLELKRNLVFFNREAEFFSDYKVVDLPDSGIVRIPKNCEVKQLAVQFSQPDVGGKRYLINKKIWDKLEGYSQAALIIHELIAKKYFLSGHRTTEHARGLVSSLFSDQFLDLESEFKKLKEDERRYYGLLFFINHRLLNHVFMGMDIRLTERSFSEPLVFNFKVERNQSFEIFNSKIILNSDQEQHYLYNERILFFESLGDKFDLLKFESKSFKSGKPVLRNKAAVIQLKTKKVLLELSEEVESYFMSLNSQKYLIRNDYVAGGILVENGVPVNLTASVEGVFEWSKEQGTYHYCIYRDRFICSLVGETQSF